LNEADGYYYQRVRQVDENGNLVGIGDQRIRLRNPGSTDGQTAPNIDLLKVGKMGGDIGQIGIGIFKRDPRMVAKGATSFGEDVKNGLWEDYKSWPGTDKPWEQDDIPAPYRDFTAPDSGSALPTPTPSSPHSESVPVRRLVRVTGGSPSAPAVPPPTSAPQSADAVPLDGYTSSPTDRGGSPDRRGFLNGGPQQLNFATNSVSTTSPQVDSPVPIGIVSGKPMRFLGAPIFDTRMPAKPMEDPQGPLNDAYLEYLKRLNAGQVH
jgi:hypothetical protein